LNQIVSADFAQDSANSAVKSFRYDTYGNLLKTPDAEYVYDLRDRLCEVRKADGTVVKYSYDALGQRIASEEITTKGTNNLENFSPFYFSLPHSRTPEL
jgi:YD repeat-containing protein